MTRTQVCVKNPTEPASCHFLGFRLRLHPIGIKLRREVLMFEDFVSGRFRVEAHFFAA